MKVGAPHPRLSPSLWTAPDESWKPWQQARTQESAKTLAPLKSRSMKRLLVPLFSHTNTTLYTIKTHRRMLTAWTDVHFRSIHLTDWKAASRPLHQHNRGAMWSSQVKMLLHIQKKGWKYCDRYILKSRTSCKSSPWCLYELFKILYSILWTSASEGSAPYPALPCPALESPLTPSYDLFGKQHLPQGSCLQKPIQTHISHSSAKTAPNYHYPTDLLTDSPSLYPLISLCQHSWAFRPYISCCRAKLKPDLNCRNTVEHHLKYFSPARYYPNRILGGAQWRFWMDDECQIEEYQIFHSVREDCHLEDENSYAHKEWMVVKTTPKPFSYHMPATEMLC